MGFSECKFFESGFLEGFTKLFFWVKFSGVGFEVVVTTSETVILKNSGYFLIG